VSSRVAQDAIWRARKESTTAASPQAMAVAIFSPISPPEAEISTGRRNQSTRARPPLAERS
jgi:hypothetical protein